MIAVVDYGFGPGARNRLGDAVTPGISGAVAALESFYYALNQADMPVLTAVWCSHDLAQLNNPVGGIVRSTPAIADVYRRIFASGMDVHVMFIDVATYELGDAVLFAGRELGSYRRNDGRRVALNIRTSRLFGWDDAQHRWSQLHHYGSIDDPFALADYQTAARH